MTSRIVYCHCAFARVVPAVTKTAVLKGLVSQDIAFEAVPDLCEMAAAKDPRLQQICDDAGPLRIAACYPRAVKWLFASAGVNIDRDNVTIVNMRAETSERVLATLTEDA